MSEETPLIEIARPYFLVGDHLEPLALVPPLKTVGNDAIRLLEPLVVDLCDQADQQVMSLRLIYVQASSSFVMVVSSGQHSNTASIFVPGLALVGGTKVLALNDVYALVLQARERHEELTKKLAQQADLVGDLEYQFQELRVL